MLFINTPKDDDTVGIDESGVRALLRDVVHPDFSVRPSGIRNKFYPDFYWVMT